jgi:hypothetical protein
MTSAGQRPADEGTVLNEQDTGYGLQRNEPDLAKVQHRARRRQ